MATPAYEQVLTDDHEADAIEDEFEMTGKPPPKTVLREESSACGTCALWTARCGVLFAGFFLLAYLVAPDAVADALRGAEELREAMVAIVVPTQQPSPSPTRWPTPAPTPRPSLRPTPPPTPPTEQPTSSPMPDPYGLFEDEEWKVGREGKQAFLQQPGVCYFDNVLRRVNNRPGSVLTCFSACAGLNLHLRDIDSDMQCLGWTLVRKRICDDMYDENCHEDERGSNVCLLHHTFEEGGKIPDASCLSGKLLQKDLRFLPQPGTPVPIEDARKRDYNATAAASQNVTADDGIADAADSSVLVPPPAELPPVENFTETCPSRVELMGDAAFKRPMRVFIACMQSSGCTLLSYLLAQRDKTTSLLDLGPRQTVPSGSKFYERAVANFPKVDTIVIKATLRGRRASDPVGWLRRIKEAFKPDVTILFLRNPVDNYLHLATHIPPQFDHRLPTEAELSRCRATGGGTDAYGITCGLPEHKLEALERLYKARERLGMHVVTYESICQDRAKLARDMAQIGICIPETNLRMPKWSMVDVMRYSYKYFLSGRRSHGGVFWGVGNLENTFHDRWGENESEERAFRMCEAELDSETLRPKLLKRTVRPYSNKTPQETKQHVKSLAPTLSAWYEQQDQEQNQKGLDDAEPALDGATPTQP